MERGLVKELVFCANNDNTSRLHFCVIFSKKKLLIITLPLPLKQLTCPETLDSRFFPFKLRFHPLRNTCNTR